MGWNSCIKLGNNMRREKGNVCGMIKDDRIYQVLLKYNFDLFRGDKSITEYMREHRNQFYCDICDAVKGDNSFLGEDFVNLLKDELGGTSGHLFNHTGNS